MINRGSNLKTLAWARHFVWRVNPNQGGIFGRSIEWGGVESAHGSFWAISSSFSHPNQPNMISNESLHLYLTLESLNSILSCKILPFLTNTLCRSILGLPNHYPNLSHTFLWWVTLRFPISISTGTLTHPYFLSGTKIYKYWVLCKSSPLSLFSP